MEDKLTETVLGMYLYQSPKAIKVLLVDGSTIWIPTSIIRSEFDWSNVEDFQAFEVDKWFIEKNELEVEL